MSYAVHLERAAGKAFDALPPATKRRVAAAIDLLAENPGISGLSS